MRENRTYGLKWRGLETWPRWNCEPTLQSKNRTAVHLPTAGAPVLDPTRGALMEWFGTLQHPQAMEAGAMGRQNRRPSQAN